VLQAVGNPGALMTEAPGIFVEIELAGDGD
jgi:hypothetical protein